MSFEARKPTALELCEFYNSEFPQKICGLRADSLGFLLNYANVNAYSRVLLVENTRGFLTGALLERCVPYVLRVDF